jgi:type II secretory pathway component PulK
MDVLTVLPGRRSKPSVVNVNTASREVLLGILGLEQEEWVQYILVMRKDQPLASIDAMSVVANPTLMGLVRPYLGVRSDTFRIEARAFEGGRSAQLWALVRRNEAGDVEVLRWVY